MVLVTRPAPDFTAAAVLGSGEIVENFNFKLYLRHASRSGY
jgi:peroxiredoxin (alkyl hydroperoxide reductase subunit C)